jgi:hypothetical protein
MQISPTTVSMDKVRCRIGCCPHICPEYRLVLLELLPLLGRGVRISKTGRWPEIKTQTGMRMRGLTTRGLTTGTEDRMTNVRWTLLAAHRRNLERYRRITTPLTDVERSNVKRRMMEERQQIERLQHELETEHPLALSA